MLYLISEGDVYTRENAPDHLRGHNFGDWAIFEAASEDEALRMAAFFDESINARASNFVERKANELRDKKFRDEYADLRAFDWLDVMPNLRFSHHGFKDM